MKLTKKVVESLPATGTRYEVRDETVTGFLVRVGVTGEKTFYLMYRAGKGRGAAKRRLALGAFPDVSVEQARSLARARLAQVTMGEDPAAMLKEAKATRTVHSVLEQFLAEHVRPRLKPGTIRTYEQQAAAIVLPALGKMKITDVQPRHIGKLHHQMRATPYQANRVISLLSKFFNWCEVAGFRGQIVLRKLTEGLLKKESPMTVVLHTINLNNEELSWGKASYPNSQGIHRASVGENIHQKNRRTSWLQSGGYFKGNQAKFQQKRNI